MAKKLSENIGQSVVVENKAGAGGNIAAQHAVSAPPDGYLIHLSSVGPLTVAPAMSKNLGYDPKKDLAPLTLGMMFPNVFVVHPSVPAKTLAEFVALAKKKPGELNYASSGIGGAAHLAGELFKQRAGIDMVHVPYKGSGPAHIDLMGGQIQLMFDNIVALIPHVKSGKVRALAVSSAKRHPALPDVPTIQEAGIKDFETVAWFGIVAPAGTPRPVLARLNEEVLKAMKLPDVEKRLIDSGSTIIGNKPEEADKFLRDEVAKWGTVVKAANVKPN